MNQVDTSRPTRPNPPVMNLTQDMSMEIMEMEASPCSVVQDMRSSFMTSMNSSSNVPVTVTAKDTSNTVNNGSSRTISIDEDDDSSDDEMDHSHHSHHSHEIDSHKTSLANGPISPIVVNEPPAFPDEEFAPEKECTKVQARVYFPSKFRGGRGQIRIVDNILIPIPEEETNQNAFSLTSSYADLIRDPEGMAPPPSPSQEKAYMILHSVRSTIYGTLYKGQVLKRRRIKSTTTSCPLSPFASRFIPSNSTSYEWEATNEYCAIKQMDWDKVQRGMREHSSENAFKEMAAMTFIQERLQSKSKSRECKTTTTDSRLMVATDIFSDDDSLYCIMPYLNNGDLFDVVDDHMKAMKQKQQHQYYQSQSAPPLAGLPESECRYWFQEILKAVEEMHAIGVCHRDLSLENIMVDEHKRVQIIDWGMCLRIPTTKSDAHSNSQRHQQRCLISTQERCGKMTYMSPEVYNSTCTDAQPYDTCALDLWSVGVILFTMVLGEFQWDVPSLTDDRFRQFTSGNMSRILKAWEVGLSEELMDLLEKMLMADPKDRLSLEEIQRHPWMQAV